MFDTVTLRLKRLISDELDVNLAMEEIDENASLFEGGLGLDSIAIVEFIGLVEKTFGVEFSDAELTPEAFATITALATVLSQKLTPPTRV